VKDEAPQLQIEIVFDQRFGLSHSVTELFPPELVSVVNQTRATKIRRENV
jgi:hypothetical protein